MTNLGLPEEASFRYWQHGGTPAWAHLFQLDQTFPSCMLLRLLVGFGLSSNTFFFSFLFLAVGTSANKKRESNT
jgi:hypothetical protein